MIDQKSACVDILSPGIILKFRVFPLSSNGHMSTWTARDSAASRADRVVKSASTAILPGDTLALRGLSNRVTNVNARVQRAGTNISLVAVEGSDI